MKTLAVYVAILFAIAEVAHCAQDIAPRWTGEGKTVGFVGNGITQSGYHVKHIILYYITRFPHAEIKFANYGANFDTAKGICERFDTDIMRGISPKPDCAIILAGTLDASPIGGAFAMPDTRPNLSDSEKLENFKADMSALIGKFKKARVKCAIVSPPIYDEHTISKTHPKIGFDKTLSKFSEFLKALAAENRLVFADAHALTSRLNAGIIGANPAGSIMGPDRMHPQNPCGFAIAAEFLKSAKETGIVSETEISLSPKPSSEGKKELSLEDKIAETKSAFNCDISELKIENGILKFDSLENALPYPVYDAISKVAEALDFNGKLNRQMLKISGLPNGKYALEIDGEPIDIYTAEEFSEGINLGADKRTPQFKQALEVLALAETRRRDESRYRNIPQIEHIILKNPDKGNSAEECRDAAKAYVDKHYDQYRYVRFYLNDKPNQKTLQDNIRSAETKMRDAAKPVKHSFKISKYK